ncbi:hypothetical protein Tco_0342462, partial [Tanacetum coccineum]
KPEVPDDIHVPTIAERLSKHEDVIQELYDHMLKFPAQRLTDIEEENKAQEVRAVTDETQRARLLDRVKVLEGSNIRLQNALSVVRERADSFQHCLVCLIIMTKRTSGDLRPS